MSLRSTIILVDFVLTWKSTCAQTPADVGVRELDPIVIAGNPLRSDLFDMVPPVTVLAGEKLRIRSTNTLGEVLGIETGLSSTYYGPNSSRPVIRGLDGDHIRILQNSVGAMDASSTSVDHAVSIEPLLVQRIEVVRGPATLLYGTSAVGGVVNVVDNRIPSTRLSAPFAAAVNIGYDSVNRGKSGAALLEAGIDNIIVHIDGFKRDTGNLKIPRFARSERLRATDPLPSGESEPHGRLPNSASDAEGGALGASYIGDRGYLGIATSFYDNRYGVVAEEDVIIKLKHRRLDLAGELQSPFAFIRSAKVRAGHVDYEHNEVDKGEVVTTFKNRGYEARLDITHHKFGFFEGSIGVQAMEFDFSALGEEAFLPKTGTRSHAVFLYEEIQAKAIKFQFGGRVDHQRVNAQADERFGDAHGRRSTTRSSALGAAYLINRDYLLAASLSLTERAPNYQELYANGPHTAAAAFEVGDRDLDAEKSTAVDVSLRKRNGPIKGSMSLYHNRFRNFITLVPTGEIDEESEFERFVYQGVRARFHGAEAEATIEINPTWSVELRGDVVRASDRGTGKPLPRIPPSRFGVALLYTHEDWSGRLEAFRVQAQKKTSENESPTDGYTLLNAAISYRLRVAGYELEAMLKGSNLLDREGRNHVSFLKERAPLPARGVSLNVAAKF